MVSEKSLFFYGRPYHLVFDRMNKALRQQVFERVPEGSTVLDVASGTGELALALRERKNCHVLGIDLSRRMIDFARKRNPYDEVTFELKDAVNGLQEFAERSFDVAVVSQLLHEVPADIQVAILHSVTRVAGKTLLLDYGAPLSVLGPGAVPRLIEGTVGRDHHANFRAFVASGGLAGLVDRAGLGVQVVEMIHLQRGDRPASRAEPWWLTLARESLLIAASIADEIVIESWTSLHPAWEISSAVTLTWD